MKLLRELFDFYRHDRGNFVRFVSWLIVSALLLYALITLHTQGIP